MRTSIIFSVVSLLLWVLMGPIVQAEEKKSGMCSMCMMHHKEMEHAQADPAHVVPHLLTHAKEIGLSTDQIAKLKALRLDLERTRIKSDAEIRIAALEVDALVEEEQADLSAIEAKVKHKAALKAGLEVATIKVEREALASLTPDQRQKEKAVREKMMEHLMGGMMERMQPKTSEPAPDGKSEHQH